MHPAKSAECLITAGSLLQSCTVTGKKDEVFLYHKEIKLTVVSVHKCSTP